MTTAFRSRLGALLCGAAFALPAAAQTSAPIVYPAKGQSAEQQTKDQNECSAWAKQSTGIDPATVAATPPPAAPAEPPKDPKGERLRGAARGAAAGAVVGEVADNDADEGAKVGAAAGVIAGDDPPCQQHDQHERRICGVDEPHDPRAMHRELTGQRA